jgi:hypothetical protein
MQFRIFIAGATLATFAGSALAQDVILLPEEEVIVREYIVKQPRPQVVVPDGYEVSVGERLPETIEVSPVDAPGFTREFEYVVVEGRTLLVDPDTREVVKVMDY